MIGCKGKWAGRPRRHDGGETLRQEPKSRADLREASQARSQREEHAFRSRTTCEPAGRAQQPPQGFGSGRFAKRLHPRLATDPQAGTQVAPTFSSLSGVQNDPVDRFTICKFRQ